MDFTNPVAGYSVVGASDASGAVNAFAEAGLIRFFLTDTSLLSGIKPESSVSYNLSVEVDASRSLHGELRLFHNDVKDLIDNLPVATKINGQNIFTYTNLNRIYTQGINADIRWQPIDRLSLSVGYQYLETVDKDVISEIEDGRVFTRIDGVDRRITRTDYGGLFNRSKHSGAIRAAYRIVEPSLVVTIRGIYRSRYGYGDLNGNLILDDIREYVPGYTVWNLTISRQLASTTAVQAGIRNLFSFTNATLIPSLPGRVLFLGLTMTL
jgi:outer membrane receptor for ferrienterochelin and colicins